MKINAHLPDFACSLYLILSFTWLLALTACSQPVESPPSKPNILLIVADDLGYSDIGCYGGNISTPNLDSLARRGIRFSRFYTSPICAPSRAMLLSGNDNHIAGIGVQNYRSEQFGYEGKLSDRVIPMPAILREAGYNTYISGKWHLGLSSESDPSRKGFVKSFVSILGASNHFSGEGLLMDEPSVYTENGEPVSWPDGTFSTDLYTDKLLEFIQSGEDSGKPFFAYAAFTAPHWPLQVEEKYWKKYEGQFDDGYEVLRRQRLESLIGQGLVGPDTGLPALHPLVRPWDSLTDEEKKIEARKMELYAGMIDNMDENIGRIFRYLRTSGQLDNTLIVFMSDNGAGDEDYYNHEYFSEYLQERYDNSYENMGKHGSFVSYGPPWAEASTAPFRYFKGYLTEGGIRAPLIMAGPSVLREGETAHSLVTLMDLAPTFYDLAGTSYPDEPALYPLKGTSLLPFLTREKETIHPDDYIFAIEHNSRTMLQQNNWKITQNEYPLALDKFELYDLGADPGEQNDLKESHITKHDELLREWEKFYRVIHGMIPPD